MHIFLLPGQKGGLGLINPRVEYHAKHMQFHLSVLNCDDPAVRHAARSSLKLHMTKRKAVPTTTSENSFAGYVTEDNKIPKNLKLIGPNQVGLIYLNFVKEKIYNSFTVQLKICIYMY